MQGKTTWECMQIESFIGHMHFAASKKPQIINKKKKQLKSPKPTQKVDTLAGSAACLPGPMTIPVKLLRFIFNRNIERIAHVRVV